MITGILNPERMHCANLCLGVEKCVRYISCHAFCPSLHVQDETDCTVNIAIGNVDLIILGLYLAGVIWFGSWIGGKQKDLSDYLLGGKTLPWWAILGSIVATETSTVTFLSVPGIAYQPGGNLQFLQLPLGYIVGRFLVILFLLPLYFRGEIYSAYEVFKKRFGGKTERLSSLTFIVMRTLADGLRLYLTALVLEKVVGIPISACVVVIGIGTIIYTCLGGMKSVVWNDCLQFVIYIAGALFAFGVIIEALPDGWSGYQQFAVTNHKWTMFDFEWELSKTYTFWAGLVGGMFLSMATHGADQLMIQRYLGARNQRDAARALGFSGFVVFLQFALFLLLGIGLAAFYQSFPPATPFEKPDEVFATFIIDNLPKGIKGLTLAAVFAAAMSTLSSSLSSTTSALVNDFYLPLTSTTKQQSELVRISRVFTVLFGLAQIFVGIASQSIESSVVGNVLAIAGISTGLILGIFFLATFSQRASQASALFGFLVGLATVLYVAFGIKGTVAWPWYTLIGAVTVFVVGIISSRFLPASQQALTEADE
ncbi:Sodium/glucose cotransporter [Gimesia panareensis]|uniref:Sodium/glucose cotransporter n=1 Tax=Gimesia panareensis TaxID=2527978 RepID=A0A518FHG0_9PLAN|nr:Sodium/glucose cotransporter [Gimesia panareensis]